MKWPRGKYNGQRIVGLEVKVVFDITTWDWCWPSILYHRCLGLGPLSAAYR